MFKAVLTSLIMFQFLNQAEASDGVYVYADSSGIEAEGGAQGERPFLEDYFSNEPEFNYFEGHALNPYQTIFLDGLDQRFLDFDYNGFRLRDPSHPTGVFNISILTASLAKQRALKRGIRFSISDDFSEGGFLEFRLSHLGEAKASVQRAVCNDKACFNTGVVLQRGGGFSQKFQGVEDDYFHKIDLNFSSVKYKQSFTDQTYVFYSGQVYDEDSAALFTVSEPESLEAESKGSTFFIGKTYEFKKNKFKGSYLQSYRTQENGQTKFSQRGEVLELQAQSKNLDFRIYREGFDLYKNSSFDLGLDLSFRKNIESLEGLNILVQTGYTEKRKLYGELAFYFRNVNLFFKGSPSSLFQASFNERFSGENKLKTQNILGLQFNRTWKVNFDVNPNRDSGVKPDVKLNFRGAYFRVYDFIDYDFTTNLYKNLDEVETGLLKLELKANAVSFFCQYQYAKNINKNQDLPRRPDWTLGLTKKQKLKKVSMDTEVKWVSSRRAFDETSLNPFWETRIKLSYSAVTFSVVNLLNQKKQVFKGLERRPATFELKYQKTF